jgi:excisionase family DNA binding protein
MSEENDNIILSIRKADLTQLYKKLDQVEAELKRIQTGESNIPLTVDQVCERLNCSRATFERLRRDPNHPLPAFKMSGGGVRVMSKKLEKWIEYESTVK